MTSTAIQSDRREELIRQRLAGRVGGRSRTIPRADRAGRLPLSFGQQQMWFLNRLEPDSPEYLVPLALRLRGSVDVAALSRAWNEIVARHEILRTRYALAGAEPVQVIDAPEERPLELVDLSGQPAAERAAAAARTVERESLTGFDLARDWPVRARLVRLAPDEHIFLLVFHHIACDEWSIDVVARELAGHYAAAIGNGRAPLAPLPVQYADFAGWQRAQAAGGGLDRHLDYWRAQLAGLEPLDLPGDRPRPAVRDWHGASVPFELPADLAAAVRDLAATHEVTLFVALLTAFQALLSRYVGGSDIAVGTAMSGRAHPQLRQLVGYGLNSVVLRARWDGDPSFA